MQTDEMNGQALPQNNMFIYMPALKWKLGEQSALKAIPPETDKSSNHMRPSIAPWKRPRSA
jgi:hypothetical protein